MDSLMRSSWILRNDSAVVHERFDSLWRSEPSALVLTCDGGLELLVDDLYRRGVGDRLSILVLTVLIDIYRVKS